MKRLFRQHDLTVMTASCGDEGLAALEQHRVQVVFSDQRMPGIRGTDFLRKVREQYPDTVRCIMSGYAEMESVVAAINDGNVYRFIAKPWNDEELTKVVDECVQLAADIAARKFSVADLARRASALEDERNRQAETLQLQDALLSSSRELLEGLPIAVAALDPHGRIIYANDRFAGEFGHLSGSCLGEVANLTWQEIARHQDPGRLNIIVDDTAYSAHVARVDIGGQAHTVIATIAD
jgi:FixJ family two-component response regulator